MHDLRRIEDCLETLRRQQPSHIRALSDLVEQLAVVIALFDTASTESPGLPLSEQLRLWSELRLLSTQVLKVLQSHCEDQGQHIADSRPPV